MLASARRKTGRGPGSWLRKAGLLAALLAGVVLYPPSLHAQGKVVVFTFGGTWLDYMKKDIIEPFQKETGIQVEARVFQNTMEGLAQLKAQKNNLDVDVWATSPIPALLAAKEGLSEPLSAADLPNSKYLPASLLKPEYVAWYKFFFGLVYNKAEVPGGLHSWKDLWSPALKGKLGIPTAAYGQGKFVVLLNWLAGGTEENADPGFALAKTLTPSVAAYFHSDTEESKFLESGEVPVASFMMVGDYLPLAESGKYEFVAPEPYVPTTVDCFALLKGKNRDNGLKFINYALGKEAQEAFAADGAVLPINSQAAAPASLAKYAPPDSQYRYVDEGAAAAHLQGWIERWNKEIQSQ
jgi:putative spermidine/putrescine transport system substrate-binding protein